MGVVLLFNSDIYLNPSSCLLWPWCDPGRDHPRCVASRYTNMYFLLWETPVWPWTWLPQVWPPGVQNMSFPLWETPCDPGHDHPRCVASRYTNMYFPLWETPVWPWTWLPQVWPPGVQNMCFLLRTPISLATIPVVWCLLTQVPGCPHHPWIPEQPRPVLALWTAYGSPYMSPPVSPGSNIWNHSHLTPQNRRF